MFANGLTRMGKDPSLIPAWLPSHDPSRPKMPGHTVPPHTYKRDLRVDTAGAQKLSGCAVAVWGTQQILAYPFLGYPTVSCPLQEDLPIPRLHRSRPRRHL